MRKTCLKKRQQQKHKTQKNMIKLLLHPISYYFLVSFIIRLRSIRELLPTRKNVKIERVGAKHIITLLLLSQYCNYYHITTSIIIYALRGPLLSNSFPTLHGSLLQSVRKKKNDIVFFSLTFQIRMSNYLWGVRLGDLSWDFVISRGYISLKKPRCWKYEIRLHRTLLPR